MMMMMMMMIIIIINVKSKFHSTKAMKAQRRSRSTTVLFLQPRR
jgi:hypothetical protein